MQSGEIKLYDEPTTYHSSNYSYYGQQYGDVSDFRPGTWNEMQEEIKECKKHGLDIGIKVTSTLTGSTGEIIEWAKNIYDGYDHMGQCTPMRVRWVAKDSGTSYCVFYGRTELEIVK